MAQLNFNDVETSNENSNQNRVSYFSLKNDGDSAVVRIMHDTVDSFDIVSKHQLRVDGKIMNVNCVRNPSDPIDACPLCAAGYKLETKIYIHMIRYSSNENGQLVCTPVIWERSLAYARQLQSLINEYGALSNCVFKIVRRGAAGSKETTYSIMFCNPNDYNDTTCPKVPDAFNGYKALGNVVYNKSVEDMSTFVQTGFFPKNQNSNNESNFNSALNGTPFDPPTLAAGNQNLFGNPQQSQPVNPSVQRPIRYY